MLRKEGADKALVRAGLLSSKALLYYDINERLSEKESKKKRTKALVIVQEVADEFKVSQISVYRAKSVMRANYQSSDNISTEDPRTFDGNDEKDDRDKHLRRNSVNTRRLGF